MSRLLIFVAIFNVCYSKSPFKNWIPEQKTYCERVEVRSNQTDGLGIVCGPESLKIMREQFEVTPVSESTISLINVGWITSVAKSPHRKFWKHCKGKMLRIFDGLFKNDEEFCYRTHPQIKHECDYNTKISGMGSGYCMRDNACGARIPIHFMSPPESNAIHIVWEKSSIDELKSMNYKVIDTCYGYSTSQKPNTLLFEDAADDNNSE
ncbi:unnamed protein product [Caenorhabditis bovis]|uniref:Uncharacterized protein n=1 Tax=Caenorhabditis bovis TaxID=2654633 RepID=A0A8S1FAS6_9PELO|nr:unnamed protein product [Caenorhabditis bovis]